MRIESQRRNQSAQPKEKAIALKGRRRRDADGNDMLKGRIHVPEIHRTKVDSLQRAVQNGDYRVSSEQIAEAMFRQISIRR